MSSSSNSLTTPKTFTTTQTINNFAINSVYINLGTSASINVTLLDTSSNIISVKSFIMSGTDYTNWGNNDIPYVINWVENQISNLTSI